MRTWTGWILTMSLWAVILWAASGCWGGGPKANLREAFAPDDPPRAPAGAVKRAGGGPERIADVAATPTLEELRDPAMVEKLIAAEKGRAKLQAEEAKRLAREDFANQVKRWTGIAMGVLTVVAVGALLLSFFVPWMSTKSALMAFAAVAVLGLGRYALLRYGTMAADVTVIVSMAAAVIAALTVGLPMGISWARRKLVKQSEVLAAKGDPRPAVALWAAGVGVTGESIADKTDRKLKLMELEREERDRLTHLRPPGVDVDGAPLVVPVGAGAAAQPGA